MTTVATSIYRGQVQQELDLIPEEFFPSLLKMIQDLRKDAAFPTAEEGFRQAWQEAMTGQTSPISELWERLVQENESMDEKDTQMLMSIHQELMPYRIEAEDAYLNREES